MSKSPEAFRTISEVAEALTVPPHVLRFWETRFPQVKPVKRGGGRRYYRPEDVRLLRGIRGLLYDEGITIKGVQKILRERGVRHVISLGTPADAAEAMAASGVRGEARAAQAFGQAWRAHPPPGPGAQAAPGPGSAEGPSPPRGSPASGEAAWGRPGPPPRTRPDPEPRQDTGAPPAAASTTQEEQPLADSETSASDRPEQSAHAAIEPRVRPSAAMDKAAIRALVEELKALRSTMAGAPGD